MSRAGNRWHRRRLRSRCRGNAVCTQREDCDLENFAGLVGRETAHRDSDLCWSFDLLRRGGWADHGQHSDLTRDRTRHAQRLEKLLEDALIKLSSVATDILSASGRDMIEALISGTRDPEVLAGMARGRLHEKHDRLVEAFAGRFDDHHAELARILLNEIDSLDAKLVCLTRRIEELISASPSPSQTSRGGGPGGLSVVERLDEIAGIGPRIAQVIVAEVGLNMAQFPTPDIWSLGRSSRRA